ncbi:hypothetical protein ACGFZR_07940 [Streptomyces sp. NPDC048241]|uniref:hypothetical protein n=1 Tax=Streptomyces sp. NPDC048241 TaxID=3365521 RepID=UPI0037242E13
MATPLPQRGVAPDRFLPDAEPVGFSPYPFAVRREDVALDMGSLADRIRQVAALTAGRQVCLPLGGRFFDVVVTASGPEASAVIATLDDLQRTDADAPDACGPVIEAPEEGRLYWLVPPGTGAQWQPHAYASCFGRPHQIVLPPMAQMEPPGIYWRRRCRADRLVPVGPLRNLLDRFRPTPVPHDVPLGRVLATNS